MLLLLLPTYIAWLTVCPKPTDRRATARSILLNQHTAAAAILGPIFDCIVYIRKYRTKWVRICDQIETPRKIGGDFTLQRIYIYIKKPNTIINLNWCEMRERFSVLKTVKYIISINPWFNLLNTIIEGVAECGFRSINHRLTVLQNAIIECKLIWHEKSVSTQSAFGS